MIRERCVSQAAGSGVVAVIALFVLGVVAPESIFLVFAGEYHRVPFSDPIINSAIALGFVFFLLVITLFVLSVAGAETDE